MAAGCALHLKHYQALRRKGEVELAVFEMQGFGWGGGAGGAELGDLLAAGRGGAAHVIEELDRVAVVGVEAENGDGGVGFDAGEVEGEVLGRAGGGGRRGVGGAFAVRGGVVPEGESDGAAFRTTGDAGGEGAFGGQGEALGRRAGGAWRRR